MTDITMLEDIDPERIDLVQNPANGFPILMLKSLDTEQEPSVPETPKTEAEGAQPETPAATTEKSSDAPAAEPQDESQPDMAALIKEAVTEANKPLRDHAEALAKELAEVRGELAKVKATPIPGGPAITAPPHMREQAKQVDLLAKAAQLERLADTVTEPDVKREYLARAAAAKAAAGMPSS